MVVPRPRARSGETAPIPAPGATQRAGSQCQVPSGGPASLEQSTRQLRQHSGEQVNSPGSHSAETKQEGKTPDRNFQQLLGAQQNSRGGREIRQQKPPALPQRHGAGRGRRAQLTLDGGKDAPGPSAWEGGLTAARMCRQREQRPGGPLCPAGHKAPTARHCMGIGIHNSSASMSSSMHELGIHNSSVCMSSGPNVIYSCVASKESNSGKRPGKGCFGELICPSFSLEASLTAAWEISRSLPALSQSKTAVGTLPPSLHAQALLSPGLVFCHGPWSPHLVLGKLLSDHPVFLLFGLGPQWGLNCRDGLAQRKKHRAPGWI